MGEELANPTKTKRNETTKAAPAIVTCKRRLEKKDWVKDPENKMCEWGDPYHLNSDFHSPHGPSVCGFKLTL